MSTVRMGYYCEYCERCRFTLEVGEAWRCACGHRMGDFWLSIVRIEGDFEDGELVMRGSERWLELMYEG